MEISLIELSLTEKEKVTFQLENFLIFIMQI